MICVICHSTMTPKFNQVRLIGEKVSKPVIVGYHCEPCTEMMAFQVDMRTLVDEIDMRELEKFKLWKTRYDEVCDFQGDCPLPEGYSYP